MKGETSNVNVEDLQNIMELVSELSEDKYQNQMFPWHIGRAIRNRLHKKDDEETKITVNDSHMRMIIKGILRMRDKEEIGENAKESMEKVYQRIS